MTTITVLDSHLNPRPTHVHATGATQGINGHPLLLINNELWVVRPL